MTEPNLDKLDQDITDILLEHLVLANDNGQPYVQHTDVAVDKIINLISNQVAKDRQQLIQRIKEEVIGKKREPSNSNSSFDLYLYATNEGYNQAIDEVSQILETIMNRSSYDR